MNIVIDNREGKLISLMEGMLSGNSTMRMTCRNMELGDVALSDGRGNDIIIERKTVADLAASIKDGRYAEQKQRLLALRGACRASSDEEDSIASTKVHIAYIIEGDIDYADTQGSRHGMLNKAFITCITRMLLQDKIAVFVTGSLKETAHLVLGLAERITEHPEKYFPLADRPGEQQQQYHPTVVKTRRGENIDTRVAFLMQLSTIPSISLKMAETIADGLSVDSMAALFDRIRSPGTDLPGGKKALVAIPRVGAAVADKVMLYLGMPLAPPEPKNKKKDNTLKKEKRSPQKGSPKASQEIRHGEESSVLRHGLPTAGRTPTSDKEHDDCNKTSEERGKEKVEGQSSTDHCDSL